jgi:GTP-binding protein HflX
MSGFEFGRNPEDVKGEVARGALTLVVLPDLRQRGGLGLDLEARLEEAEGLALAIGLNVVDSNAISKPGWVARSVTVLG